MPRWVARVVWACRGRRRVRLHLEERDGVSVSTIEGVLVGRWSGHYVLLLPKLVEAEDRSIPLDGSVEVPAERVIFVQVLS